VGSSHAAQLRTAVWALESAPDVKGLIEHL
jgi:hypothetical protein